MDTADTAVVLAEELCTMVEQSGDESSFFERSGSSFDPKNRCRVGMDLTLPPSSLLSSTSSPR
jgi:hypothetical protein